MTIKINGHDIGAGFPTFIVAEMSGNHHQSVDQAIEIIRAAKAAGADAIKLQTYTADTLTIDCPNDYFRIKGTIWEDRTLYNLYSEAYTPWDWHEKLMETARSLDLDIFSTPFDPTAVDFLEELNVPAYKIASFEIVDLPLIRKIAQTGKPIIMSTGMASLSEIDDAVRTIRDAGNNDIVLLKCTSAYPSVPDEMNLRTIPHLSQAFNLPVGLSDHTLGIAVPVAATALGACVIEKHFTISRNDPGPDSAFSLEPPELKEMVDAIRTVERAMGSVSYSVTPKETESRVFRRSLFAVKDIAQGDALTHENVRSIRPGAGLAPKYLDDIIGKKAAQDIPRGTPLNWRHLMEKSK